MTLARLFWLLTASGGEVMGRELVYGVAALSLQVSLAMLILTALLAPPVPRRAPSASLSGRAHTTPALPPAPLR